MIGRAASPQPMSPISCQVASPEMKPSERFLSHIMWTFIMFVMGRIRVCNTTSCVGSSPSLVSSPVETPKRTDVDSARTQFTLTLHFLQRSTHSHHFISEVLLSSLTEQPSRVAVCEHNLRKNGRHVLLLLLKHHRHTCCVRVLLTVGCEAPPHESPDSVQDRFQLMLRPLLIA